LLELAILGLLKEQELHGYELKKRLADTVGPGHGVSFGSIYPALGRLEKAGAVAVVPVHVGAGRGKKVYAITERGEGLFEELLAADTGSSEDERSFNLRLVFARHLSREARIGMLERRRAYLLERLARTRGAIRHGWGRFDAYSRSLMEHGNETTERDISWLDRLIAREREDGDGEDGTGMTPMSGVPGSGPPVPAGRPTRDEGPDAAPGPPFPNPKVSNTQAPNPQEIAWAASAPPTMPVRPASPSHPRGGSIQ
jgi:DNA-binding PadR family transcriptional regulator